MLNKCLFVLFLCTILSSHHAEGQNDTEGITNYIFPDFVNGVVLMKSGLKNEMLLNYNSLSEEMTFKRGSLTLAIGRIESEYIDTVYIEDHKFVSHNGKFMETLYSSENMDLFVQYKCNISNAGRSVGMGGTTSTTNVNSYSGIQKDGQVFNLKNAQEYTTSEYLVYWIKKNGTLYEAINMKKLERIFRNQKDQFREYAKENEVTFEKTEAIIGLVKFLDPAR